MTENSKMTRDTILYMAGKFVEGALGILTISLLTYTLTDVSYDAYVMWNIGVTTVAMLAIQWLTQSASRYMNDYAARGEKTVFYSTVFLAWARVNAAVLTAAVGLFLLFPRFFQSPRLMLVGACYFLSYNTSQLLISLLAVLRKPVINLIISVGSSSIKMLFILFLWKTGGSVVEIIFLGYIFSDVLVIILGIFSVGFIQHLRRNGSSPALMGEFGRYGAPLVGNLFTTTVLNNSDKYIINYYLATGTTSKYSTSYGVVSAAFTMIMAALMRGSYPTILKAHTTGDAELTNSLIARAVRNYLLVAVPAAVGISVVAKPLAVLIFAPDFVSYYKVMAPVAFGMLLLGLTEYSNKPYELSAQTIYIFRNSLIGGVLNILLNVLFMPRFGYMTAAYSTFIGFLVYFLLSKSRSRGLVKWNIPAKTYGAIFGAAAIMGVCIHLAALYMPQSKITLFAYVAIGIIVYAAVLAVSGEVTDEIEMVKRLRKRK